MTNPAGRSPAGLFLCARQGDWFLWNINYGIRVGECSNDECEGRREWVMLQQG
jgi:hypothetical protein